MTERAPIEAALKRRAPNPARAEEVMRLNAELSWRGTCRFCRTELRGLLADITAHKCSE